MYSKQQRHAPGREVVGVVYKLMVELKHTGRCRVEVFHGWMLAIGQSLLLADVLRLTLSMTGVIDLVEPESVNDAWDLSKGYLKPGPAWEESWAHFEEDVQEFGEKLREALERGRGRG